MQSPSLHRRGDPPTEPQRRVHAHSLSTDNRQLILDYDTLEHARRANPWNDADDPLHIHHIHSASVPHDAGNTNSLYATGPCQSASDAKQLRRAHPAHDDPTQTSYATNTPHCPDPVLSPIINTLSLLDTYARSHRHTSALLEQQEDRAAHSLAPYKQSTRAHLDPNLNGTAHAFTPFHQQADSFHDPCPNGADSFHDPYPNGADSLHDPYPNGAAHSFAQERAGSHLFSYVNGTAHSFSNSRRADAGAVVRRAAATLVKDPLLFSLCE